MTDTDKLDLLLAYQRLQFLSGHVPHGDLTGDEYAELRLLRGALKLCNSGQYGQIKTFDPRLNRTVTCLLTEGELKELKAATGGWLFLTDYGSWKPCLVEPIWSPSVVYRAV